MVRLLDKGLSDKSELKFLLTWVYYLHFRNNTNIKETSTSNSLQTERIRGPSKCPTTIRCHLVWWFTWIPTITHHQVGLIFYCSYLFTFFKEMIIFFGSYRQLLCVVKYACMFPLFSTIYILAPKSSMGKFARKPFLKFIFESASYIFFLFLLALASQQIEHIVMDVISKQ